MNVVRITVGRDRSVGKATLYGLNGPGIESRLGGEIFRIRPWAHPASYKMGTGSPSRGRGGLNWLRRGVDHPHHLAPGLNKEYSYTSTPLLGLGGLLYDEICLTCDRVVTAS
jgi:hypothetical protein